MLIDKLNQILNFEDESSVSYVISLFIKKNLKEIPKLSIDYIACSCHTSKSQISKYVKSLGYETMKELRKHALIMHLVLNGQTLHYFLYKKIPSSSLQILRKI